MHWLNWGVWGRSQAPVFYTYDPDSRDYKFDDVSLSIIEQAAESLDVKRRDVDAGEIVDRLIYALINEGMKIVDEGIAQRPSDVDVVYVYGYGFPAYRGGPMHYADEIGLDKVYERVCEFRDRFGADNWTPAPLLETLVKEGTSLADWAANR